MLCALILYLSGGTYSLTLTPNARFLGNSFMAGLFTLRVFARNLLREKYFLSYFDLMPDLGYEAGLMSNNSFINSLIAAS